MVIFWDSRIQTIFPRLALRLPVMDLPLHCAHSVATQVRRTVAMKRWWASNIARLFQTGAASRLAQRWAVVNTTENLTNTKGECHAPAWIVIVLNPYHYSANCR